MKHLFSKLSPAIVFTLLACGAKPSEDGTCQLKCSSARIAADEYKISKSEGGTVSCRTGQIINFTSAFVITREEAAPTVGGTGEKQNIQVVGSKDTPVGGIGFRPYVSGAGNVTTSQDEWCSDTCGVATYSFTHACVSTSVVSQIRAGSNFESITYTIENKDEDTDLTATSAKTTPTPSSTPVPTPGSPDPASPIPSPTSATMTPSPSQTPAPTRKPQDQIMEHSKW